MPEEAVLQRVLKSRPTGLQKPKIVSEGDNRVRIDGQ
jgi:hypothetical protein